MSIVNNEYKHLYTHYLTSLLLWYLLIRSIVVIFSLFTRFSPFSFKLVLTFLSHEHSCIYYIKEFTVIHFFMSTCLLLLTNTTTDEIYKSLPPHHVVSSSLLLIIVVVFPLHCSHYSFLFTLTLVKSSPPLVNSLHSQPPASPFWFH